MKTVKLSARMKALADMVSKGRIVCDVGCDHGFVSIYLVQQNIAPKVYAMDVRSGPLERAKEHISQYCLEDYIETRLSDGLKNIQVREADCMLCAGMGGPLMIKILTEGSGKAHAMKELILQPQSELAHFRKFLREEGYRIVEENMIFEEGKYYPMMKAVPVLQENPENVDADEQEVWDTYGELLLKQKNVVLQQYLEHSAKHVKQLLENLKKHSADEVRVAELERELQLIHRAQKYM